MNSSESIKNEVVGLIAKTLHKNAASILLSDTLSALAEDSLKLFELLIVFEKYYGEEVSYDDVIKLETVGDVVSYIERRQSLQR